MQRAELVAIGVAEIGQVHGAAAYARRVFDGLAAGGHAGFVPGVHLFGAVHGDADGAAVGVGGRLAVDGLGDDVAAAIVAVDHPPLGGVLGPRLGAQRAEGGVVEGLRPGEVVRPDHDVAEHRVFSP